LSQNPYIVIIAVNAFECNGANVNLAVESYTSLVEHRFFLKYGLDVVFLKKCLFRLVLRFVLKFLLLHVLPEVFSA